MNPSRSELKAQLEKRRDELRGWDGCITGDCPHEKQTECNAHLFNSGHDTLLETVLDLYEALSQTEEINQKIADKDAFIMWRAVGRGMAQHAAETARAAIQKLIGSVKV